ncbi:unnamed protein product [Prunus brigantina]
MRDPFGVQTLSELIREFLCVCEDQEIILGSESDFTMLPTRRRTRRQRVGGLTKFRQLETFKTGNPASSPR